MYSEIIIPTEILLLSSDIIADSPLKLSNFMLPTQICKPVSNGYLKYLIDNNLRFIQDKDVV